MRSLTQARFVGERDPSCADLMRHVYVGDVGDFGKHGLLRALVQHGCTRELGVIWYLTDKDERNNDGRHDGYLRGNSTRSREAFRACDPELYDKLAAIRTNKQLHLKLIERGNILPSGTSFYSSVVPQSAMRMNELHHSRIKWFDRAADLVLQSDVVFLDPDNGLLLPNEIASNVGTALPRRPSPKHAYWNELMVLLDRGQTVVAYHHLGRQRGGHAKQISRLLDRLADFGYPSAAVHYRRGSARAFFLIPASPKQRQSIFKAAAEFSSRWSAHSALIK
jgi:hypothetical protein